MIKKTIGHLIAAYIIFELCDTFSIYFSTDVALRYFESEWVLMDSILQTLFGLLSVGLLVFLYTRYVLRRPLADIGCGRPGPSLFWIAAAVAFPLLCDGFYLFFVPGDFAYGGLLESEFVAHDLFRDIVGKLSLAIMTAIVYWGMTFKYLREMWGTWKAILITSLFYALFPLPIVDEEEWQFIFLLILAAGVEGLTLTLITCESGSIWSAVIVHWLFLSLSGDAHILHINTEQYYPTLWAYALRSDNWLIIGPPNRPNSLYAALPAQAGFLILAAAAVWRYQRRQHGQA